jgi:hypothetical protein
MSQSSQSVWTDVYITWRNLLNLLVRGYQNFGFEAWTIPCLYVVSKHLRLFAIRADEERSSNSLLDDSTAATLLDDFDPDSHKHQKQEDCAGVLSKVFSICQSDR